MCTGKTGSDAGTSTGQGSGDSLKDVLKTRQDRSLSDVTTGEEHLIEADKRTAAIQPMETAKAVSKSEQLLSGQPVVVPKAELDIGEISKAHEAVGLKLSSNSHKRKKFLSKAQDRKKQQEELNRHSDKKQDKAAGASDAKDALKPKVEMTPEEKEEAAVHSYEGIADLDILLFAKKGETPFDTLMNNYDTIRVLFSHLHEYEAALRRKQQEAADKNIPMDEELLQSEARLRTLQEIKGYYDSIEKLMKNRYYVYLPMDDMLKLSAKDILGRLQEQYQLPPEPVEAPDQKEPEAEKRVYQNRELINFYEELLRLKQSGFSDGKTAKDLEKENLVYVKRETMPPVYHKAAPLPQDEAGKKAELIRIAGIFANLDEFLNDPDSVAPKADFIRQFSVTFRVNEYRDAFLNTPQDKIPSSVKALLSAIGQLEKDSSISAEAVKKEEPQISADMDKPAAPTAADTAKAAAPATADTSKAVAPATTDTGKPAAPTAADTVKATAEEGAAVAKSLISQEQEESVRAAGAYLMERCLKESDDYKAYTRELRIQAPVIPGSMLAPAARMQMPPAVIPLRSEWKNHVPFVFRMMERNPEELLIAFYLLENDKQDDASGINFLSVRRNYQPDVEKLGERLKHLTDWGKLSRALRSSSVISQWLKEYDIAEGTVQPAAAAHNFAVKPEAIDGMDRAYEPQKYNNCYCCTGTAMVNQYIAMRKKKAGTGTGVVARIFGQDDMRAYRPAIRRFDENRAYGFSKDAFDTEVSLIDSYCGPGKLITGSIAQMNDFLLDALHREGIDDVLLHNVLFDIPEKPVKGSKTDQEHAQALAVYEAQKRIRRDEFERRIREILESGSVAGVMKATPYEIGEKKYRNSTHYVTITGYDPAHGLIEIYDSLEYNGQPVVKSIESFLGTEKMIVEIDWISDRPAPAPAGADPHAPDPLVQKFHYLSGGPQYNLEMPETSDHDTLADYIHMNNASISHTKGITVCRRENDALESLYIPQNVPNLVITSLDTYMREMREGGGLTAAAAAPSTKTVSTTGSMPAPTTVKASATASSAQVTDAGSPPAPTTVKASATASSAQVTDAGSPPAPTTVKASAAASSAPPVTSSADKLTKEQAEAQSLMYDIRKRMQRVMMLHKIAGMPMDLPADLAADPELRRKLVTEMSEIEIQRTKLQGLAQKIQSGDASPNPLEHHIESGPNPLDHHIESGPNPLEVTEFTADVTKEYVGDTMIDGTVQSLEAAGKHLSFTEGPQYLLGSGVAVGALSIAGLIKDVIGTISLATEKGLSPADLTAKSIGIAGDYIKDIGGAFDAVGRIVASSAKAAESVTSNVHTPLVVKAWLEDSGTSLLQHSSQAGAWGTIVGGALGVVAGAIQITAASVQMARQVSSAKDVASARRELRNTLADKEKRGEKLTPDEERLKLFLSHQSREIDRKKASAAVGMVTGALTGTAGGLFMTGYLAPVGAILGITAMFIGAGAKICDWIQKSENRDMAVDEFLRTDDRIEELKKDRSYAGRDEKEFRVRVRDLILAEQGFSSVKECFRHVCIQYASVLFSKVFIEDIPDEERKMFVDAMSSLGMKMNDRKAVLERGEKPIPSIDAMVTRMMMG